MFSSAKINIAKVRKPTELSFAVIPVSTHYTQETINVSMLPIRVIFYQTLFDKVEVLFFVLGVLYSFAL